MLIINPKITPLIILTSSDSESQVVINEQNTKLKAMFSDSETENSCKSEPKDIQLKNKDPSTTGYSKITNKRKIIGVTNISNSVVDSDSQISDSSSSVDRKILGRKLSTPFVVIKSAEKPGVFDYESSDDCFGNLPRDKSDLQTESSEEAPILMVRSGSINRSIVKLDSDSDADANNNALSTKSRKVANTDSGTDSVQESNIPLRKKLRSKRTCSVNATKKKSLKVRRGSSIIRCSSASSEEQQPRLLSMKKKEFHQDSSTSDSSEAPIFKKLKFKSLKNSGRILKKKLIGGHLSDDFIVSTSEDDVKPKAPRRQPSTAKNRDFTTSDSFLSLSDVSASESDPGDVSFYRSIDLKAEFKASRKHNPEKTLKKFNSRMDQLKEDPDFMDVNDFFANRVMKNAEFPAVRSFLRKVIRDSPADVFSDDGDRDDAAYRFAIEKSPIMLETNILETFFNYAEYYGSQLSSNIMDYDTVRVEEFMNDLAKFGEDERGKPPNFIVGFCDSALNLYKRTLDSGSARKSTDIDVDANLQNMIHRCLLHGDCSVEKLCSETRGKSAEVAGLYTEYRDEYASARPQKFSGGRSTRINVTEKDRREAMDQLIDEGEDLTLMMCQVCQSFPRYLSRKATLRLAGDHDPIVVLCTDTCGDLLEQISVVAKVWQVLQDSSVITTIPHIVHQYHRSQESYTHFELFKIMVFSLIQRLKDGMMSTNTCRHHMYANAAHR